MAVVSTNDIVVNVVGADRAANEMAGVARSEAAAGEAARKAAVDMRQWESAIERAREDAIRQSAASRQQALAQFEVQRSLQGTTRAAGSFGQTFASVGRTMSTVTSTIGKGTFALQSMAAFIGGGVLGPLGALVTAGVAVADALGLMDSKADAVAASTREMSDALQQASDVARGSAGSLNAFLGGIGVLRDQLDPQLRRQLEGQERKRAAAAAAVAEAQARRQELAVQIESGTGLRKVLAKSGDVIGVPTGKFTSTPDAEQIEDVKRITRQIERARTEIAQTEQAEAKAQRELDQIDAARREVQLVYQTEKAKADAIAEAYKKEQAAAKARREKAAADAVRAFERAGVTLGARLDTNPNLPLEFGRVGEDLGDPERARRLDALEQERFRMQAGGVDARIAAGRESREAARAASTLGTLDQLATTVPTVEGILVNSFGNIAMSFGAMTSQMIIAGNASGASLKKWAGEVLASISAQAIGYGTLALLLAPVATLLGLPVGGGALAVGGAALVAFGIGAAVAAKALGAGGAAGGGSSAPGVGGGENRGRQLGSMGGAPEIAVHVYNTISRSRFTDEVEAETAWRGTRRQRTGSRLAFAGAG